MMIITFLEKTTARKTLLPRHITKTKKDLEIPSSRTFPSSPKNRPPAEKLPAPRWRQVKNLENYGYFCGPFLGGRKKKGSRSLIENPSSKSFLS